MIKRILYILSAIFVLILGLLILIPYLYQDELQNLLREEINNSVTATLDFEDVSLSLLKRFPDANLTINNLSIVEGKDSTLGDTILDVQKIDLTLDLMSVIRSEETVEVIGLYFNKPDVFLYTDDNGVNNYDIFISDTTTSTSDSDAAYYDLRLQDYDISEARLKYIDKFNGVMVNIDKLNHSGNGRYRGKMLQLSTTSSFDNANVNINGTSYLTKAILELLLDLSINFDEGTYVITNSDLLLNRLKLRLQGQAKEVSEGMALNISLDAPNNEFGELWSLVPGNFRKDYEGLKTSGSFSLNGEANGVYDYTTGSLPGINLSVTAVNGTVRYPDLPNTLTNINADLEYRRPEGSQKNIVNVRQLDFSAGESVFGFKGQIDQSNRQTSIDGFLKADAQLQDFPLDGENSGLVQTDIEFNGLVDDIINKRYDRFNLTGTAALKDVNIDMESQPDIWINSPQVEFSPQSISMPETTFKMGDSRIDGLVRVDDPLGFLVDELRPTMTLRVTSDYINWDQLTADDNTPSNGEEPVEDDNAAVTTLLPFDMLLKGEATVADIKYGTYDIKDIDGKFSIDGQTVQIEPSSLTYSGNPLQMSGELNDVGQYVYSDGKLKGTMSLEAQKFDLNRFMEDGTEEESTGDDLAAGTYVIPDYMDLDVTTNITQVLYDSYTLDDLKGDLSIDDQQLDLTGLTTRAFGGTMALVGAYKSDGKAPASFNFKYDVSQMPFTAVYQNILSIKEIAPLGKFIEGIFNSTLVVEGQLGAGMMPDLGSLTASGYIETLEGELARLPFIEKLANKLAVSKLKELDIEDTKNWFEIKNGEFIIEPFSFTHEGITVDASGKTSLAKTLELDLKISVPREQVDQIPGGAAVGKGLDWAQREISRLGLNIEEVDTYVFGVDVLGQISNPSIKFNMLDGRASGGGNVVTQAGDRVKEKLVDTLQKEKDKLIDETKQKVDEEVQKAKDSLQTRIDEEKQKAEERIKKEIEKKANEVLDSTTKEVIKEKADDILGKDADKKVEELKNKLDEFNPFKKKKK